MKIKFVYINNKLETWSGTFCHVNMRAKVREGEGEDWCCWWKKGSIWCESS